MPPRKRQKKPAAVVSSDEELPAIQPDVQPDVQTEVQRPVQHPVQPVVQPPVQREVQSPVQAVQAPVQLAVQPQAQHAVQPPAQPPAQPPVQPPAPPPLAPARQRKEKLCLSADDEQDVADWFKANEIFYNKSLRAYRDNKRKERLYEEKAATLTTECTGKQLKTWLESMRTTFGKLKRAGPSGTEKPNPTDKESWILRNFECCAPYIYRAPGRQAVKLKEKIQRQQGAQHADSDFAEVSDCSSVTSETSRPRQLSTLVQGLTSSISELQTHTMVLGKQAENETPAMKTRRLWAEYLHSEALLLDEEAWEEMRQLTVMNMYRLQKESRRRQERQQQPVPHGPYFGFQQPQQFVPPPRLAAGHRVPALQPDAPLPRWSPVKEWDTPSPMHGARLAVPVSAPVPVSSPYERASSSSSSAAPLNVSNLSSVSNLSGLLQELMPLIPSANPSPDKQDK